MHIQLRVKQGSYLHYLTYKPILINSLCSKISVMKDSIPAYYPSYMYM